MYATNQFILSEKKFKFENLRFLEVRNNFRCWVDHCLLSLHRELVKGSGLYEILANNNLPTIGTGAAVNTNPIKQARYCLQVAVTAV